MCEAVSGACSGSAILQFSFVKGFLRRPFVCLCPCMDCQYSSCFLFIQSLITPLASLPDKPCAGSGQVSWWPVHQLSYIRKVPCVPVHIPVWSCYVLPVSPGTDSSPRLFGIYLQAVKGPDGCLTVTKNTDVPTCVALFCILIRQALMAYISA